MSRPDLLFLGYRLPAGSILPVAGPATDNQATAHQVRAIEDRLRHEIEAGALGIGMGIQYTPGATRLEVIRMFQLHPSATFPYSLTCAASGA